MTDLASAVLLIIHVCTTEPCTPATAPLGSTNLMIVKLDDSTVYTADAIGNVTVDPKGLKLARELYCAVDRKFRLIPWVVNGIPDENGDIGCAIMDKVLERWKPALQ